MAVSSLFALIDDIASVLDDVAAMTKVAAKKTSGVLGDDLALNAEQVSGVVANRELPVVAAVAWGSFKNKLILVPLALILNAVAPWAVTPLLVLGGLFLCFEGFEKLAHPFLHPHDEADEKQGLISAAHESEADLLAFEKDKIKGAIRTDFVLSAEIIIITLGTVADKSFLTQISVLSAIAVIMTLGVYGLVAGIVKLDDIGLYLLRRQPEAVLAKAGYLLGRALLAFAPRLMKALTVIGTVAMFMVGGGILTHAVHWSLSQILSLPAWLSGLADSLCDALIGVLAGALCLAVISGLQKLKAGWRKPV